MNQRGPRDSEGFFSPAPPSDVCACRYVSTVSVLATIFSQPPLPTTAHTDDASPQPPQMSTGSIRKPLSGTASRLNVQQETYGAGKPGIRGADADAENSPAASSAPSGDSRRWSTGLHANSGAAPQSLAGNCSRACDFLISPHPTSLSPPTILSPTPSTLRPRRGP